MTESPLNICWNKSNMCACMHMCVCVCVCVCVFACVRDSVGLCVESKLDVITEKLSNQPTHCLINSYNTNTHTHTHTHFRACSSVFSAVGHMIPTGVFSHQPKSLFSWTEGHNLEKKSQDEPRYRGTWATAKRKENFRRHRRTARYICQSGWLLLSSVSHRAAGFPTEPTLMYPAEVWLNQYRS